MLAAKTVQRWAQQHLHCRLLLLTCVGGKGVHLPSLKDAAGRDVASSSLFLKDLYEEVNWWDVRNVLRWQGGKVTGRQGVELAV